MNRMANTVRWFSSTKPLPWQSTPLFSFLLDQNVADEDLWFSQQCTGIRRCFSCVGAIQIDRSAAADRVKQPRRTCPERQPGNFRAS
jgi:hypothetical protein